MTDSDATCANDVATEDRDGSDRTEVDFEKSPPSIAIVSAIAALEDVPPGELSFVLHDHVDGDALDRLLNDDREGPLEVRFRIDDYEVCIGRDGTVVASFG